MKKEKRINSLTWGLFTYKIYNPTNWRFVVKDFKSMIKRLIFVIKHGFYPQMLWETHFSMCEQFKDIINYFRTEAEGYPSEFENFSEWEAILVELLNDLEIMSWDWGDDKIWEDWVKKNQYKLPKDILNTSKYTQFDYLQNTVKDEFFKLFSKYFYNFWD